MIFKSKIKGIKKYIALFLTFLMLFQNADIMVVLADEISHISQQKSEETEDIDNNLNEENNNIEDEENNSIPEDTENPATPEEGSEIPELPIEEIVPPTEENTTSIPKEVILRDFVLDTDEFSQEVMLLIGNSDYNALTEEEKDILLLDGHLREDTMSVLAENGYSITESIPLARIMQMIDIEFYDVLIMVENHRSLGNAHHEALLLRETLLNNVNLFSNAESKASLSMLLVQGHTTKEAINIYTMSILMETDTEEIASFFTEYTEEDLNIPEDILDNNAEISAELPTLELPENELPEIEIPSEETSVDKPGEEDEITEENENQEEMKDEENSNQNDINMEENQVSETYIQSLNAMIDVDNETHETDENEETKESKENDESDSEDLEEENQGENPSEEDENSEIQTPQTEEEIEQPKYALSTDDISLIINIANNYNINPQYLLDFVIKNEIDPSKLELYLKRIKAMNSFEDEEKEETINLMRASSGSEYIPTPHVSFDYPSSPYNYRSNNSENININTGALIYKDNIISLKGKGDLDLDVSFIYDSSEAAEESTYGHAFGIYACDYDYIDTDDRYIIPVNYQAGQRSKPTDYIAAGWSINTSKVFVQQEHYIVDPGMKFYQEYYLKLDNGNTYMLNDKMELMDYKLSDIKLEKDISGTFAGSGYIVTHANGVKEYIGSATVAKVDKYGNKITYSYTTTSNDLNKTIEITDTIGRKVNINTNGKNITVTLPDKGIVKYLREIMYLNGLDYTRLAEKTDQLGRKTTFSYKIEDASFDYFNQVRKPEFALTWADTYKLWMGGPSLTPNRFTYIGDFRFVYAGGYFAMHYQDFSSFYNYSVVGKRYSDQLSGYKYHNLVKVTHPTGAYTAYTYNKAIKRFGSIGNSDYYTVSSRADYADGKEYNKVTYTYGKNDTGNNYTGYNLKYNESSIPDTYEYWVTEKSGNMTTTFVFNHKHQIKSKTVEGAGIVNKTVSTYDDNSLRLSTENTTTKGSNSVTTKEMFEYDKFKNVTAYWSPLANGDKKNTEHKTTFTYDSTYQMPTSKTYKLDANTTVKENYTLSSDKKYIAKQEVLLNDALNQKTEFTVNAVGAVTRVRNFIDASKYLDETFTYKDNLYVLTKTMGGFAEQFTYDTHGNILTLKDKNKNEYVNTYDQLGRLLKTVNPDKSYVETKYDDSTNTITTWDENRNSFKYYYNKLGLIEKTQDLKTNDILNQITYDSFLNILTESDPNNVVTTYTYDNLNRPISMTKADYKESYEYEDAFESTGNKIIKTVKGDIHSPDLKTAAYTDKYNRKIAESAYDGSTEVKTTYEYDYAGRVTSFLNPGDKAKGSSYTTKYEYGISEKPLKTINILGNSVLSQYDFLGRSVSNTDAKGNKFTFLYNAQGLLSEEAMPFENNTNSKKTYIYDGNGNITRQTQLSNKVGETTKQSVVEYTYNNRNQLTEVNSGNIKTVYTYDLVGNKLTMKVGNSTNTYEYDHLSRIQKSIDGMGHIETYAYDKLGNLTQKVDRNANTTKNEYNKKGQITKTTVENINGVNEEHMTYTYSSNNLLLKLSNENLTTEYKYDKMGRKVQEKDSDGVIREYSYDLNNNKESFKLLVDNKLTLDMKYQYDKMNRLEKVFNMNMLKSTYSYDENGNRSQMITGNGVITEYTYNNANLVKTLTNKKDNKTLSGFSYTYYLDGNQASKTDKENTITSYIYDNVGRLSQEKEVGLNKNTTWDYAYDQNSNRSKMTVTKDGKTDTTVYTYDNNNRLLKEFSQLGTTDVQRTNIYSYDGNGNQITKSSGTISLSDVLKDPTLRIYMISHEIEKHEVDYNIFNEELSGEVSNISEDKEPKTNISLIGKDANLMGSDFNSETNVYDGFNRLVRTATKGTVAEYAYKQDGLRYSKTVNGDVTVHVWDGSNIVADLDDSNTTLDTYVRGINLIESKENGFYIYNAHGDVVNLTDSSGVSTKEYSYDAFGVEEGIDDEDLNPFRYCGEYFDKETGRVYLRARYYVPSLGRFMTEDPINSGLNWYTYANNNPLKYFDPSGKVAIAKGSRDLAFASPSQKKEQSIRDIAKDWKMITTGSQEAIQLAINDFQKTFYGAARPYIDPAFGTKEFNNLNALNCYSYALGLKSAKNPGFKSGIKIVMDGDNVSSLEYVTNAVLKDLDKLGRAGRIIDGPNGIISYDEYRIALRVGTKPIDGTIDSYDYHFMVQHDDGRWSEKHGERGFWEIHDYGITPDNATWNIHKATGDLLEAGYYDSDIIYIAVKKN